jgi:hypothetical protein
MVGLPEAVRYKVLSKQEKSSHAPVGSVNYGMALRVVKAITETEEMMDYFVTQPERQTNISELAETLNENKPLNKDNQARGNGKSDDVDILAERFKAMALPIATAAERFEAAAASMQAVRPVPVNKPQTGLDPALEKKKPREDGGHCFCCGETTHYKPNCPYLKMWFLHGDIHYNVENLVCLG